MQPLGLTHAIACSADGLALGDHDGLVLGDVDGEALGLAPGLALGNVRATNASAQTEQQGPMLSSGN